LKQTIQDMAQEIRSHENDFSRDNHMKIEDNRVSFSALPGTPNNWDKDVSQPDEISKLSTELKLSAAKAKDYKYCYEQA
jgi:hypothetical protein